MALSRIPLPSITLVLTSGSHSPHGYPTAIKLAPPSMLQTTPDHLMKTVDLRGEPDEIIQTPPNVPVARIDHGCIRLQTILEEEEEFITSPAVEKQNARSTKQYVLMFLQSLRCKLLSARK